ncbi:urea transporter, putative [Acanthamoeba castellanii str. Neff]|uniref:Urea transporter, putative n=1 Tax=Acanthamoeba castellanii (strain ATCC 30010 / Neff) TaxID=1257118 RepID=L8GWK4_ACACF|nr:urea transporter, putative [Acanthamoeba castellanii str. Neff]ELR16476.1 urea transporter, putative [Acanthamoeba castellanii str. Neff]
MNNNSSGGGGGGGRAPREIHVEVEEEDYIEEEDDDLSFAAMESGSKKAAVAARVRGKGCGGNYYLGTMPEWSNLVKAFGPLDFLDYTLRGCGQVYFMNNPISGLILLIGLVIEKPLLAVGCLIAQIGVDIGARRAGLTGYNGILVGAAIVTFMKDEWDIPTLIIIVPYACISVLIWMFLGNIMVGTWNIPPFTFAFNFTATIFFIAYFPLAMFTPSLPTAASPGFDWDTQAVFEAVFKGVGQVMFAGSTASGVIMTLALAACSPIAAMMAVLGSSIGVLVGFAVGADAAGIEAGLWGYNPVLGAIAVGGMFYYPTVKTLVMTVINAGFCSLLFGFFKVALAPWGIPAFTFPFCFATMVVVGIGKSLPDFEPIPLPEVTVPEEHLCKRWQRSRGLYNILNGPLPFLNSVENIGTIN